MDRIKDYREENAISIFFNNCTDKGILNAIDRRKITRFTDLASIVRKYCAMESFRKTENQFWDNPAPNQVRSKRAPYTKAPDAKTKKQKPNKGNGTVLEGWLNGPCKLHSTEGAVPTHSLRACWILRQVAKSGEDLLIPNATEHHPVDNNMVLTVFETFASNNMRKRTIHGLAEVYQVATANPWSDTAITFNASDEPKFRTTRAPAALILSPIVD